MKAEDCPVAAKFYLPYLAWHEDAEKRAANGQEQALCATCQRWTWPDRAKACPRFTRDEAGELAFLHEQVNGGR